MKLDDTINVISTIITASFQTNSWSGSGFFFHEEHDDNPELKDPKWLRIDNVWLVTNRHVLLFRDENKEEYVPESLTLHLRKIDPLTNAITWHPITLTKPELINRIRLHTNPDVDIAAIQISDLLKTAIDSVKHLTQWSAVSERNLPGKNKISVEVADDALVIGYPKGYYDDVNCFPIVKSGIISTRWGSPFRGKPYFLIDAKLFPGSSGSLVISRPTHQVVENGQMYLSAGKQFAFLGVFSGEPYRNTKPIELDNMTIIVKDGFNLGIVWYSYLVVEIIKSGEDVTKQNVK